MLSSELMRAFKPFPKPGESTPSYSGAFLTLNISAARPDNPDPDERVVISVRLNLWPIRDASGKPLAYPEGTIGRAVTQVISIIGGNDRFVSKVAPDGMSAALDFAPRQTKYNRVRNWPDMVNLFAPRSDEDEVSLCECMSYPGLAAS
jgi:hypothetical protein